MVRDYSINVIKHTFQVLEVLASAKTVLSVREISQRIGISENSVFRILYSLEEPGYVWKDPKSKKYQLGVGLFRLGNAVFPNHDLRDSAVPILQNLLQVFEETVNLGILQDAHIIYIERLESPRSLRTSNEIGSRAPVFSTSLGKAIMAYLPDDELEEILDKFTPKAITPQTIVRRADLERELEITRQRGYSIDNEENVEGVYCIGAPIFNRFGSVEAAISLSAPIQRLDEHEKRQKVALAVMQAANDISLRLGSKRKINIE